MEREVGGGVGMGNTYKPMAVSFQFMTKSTTIKKKIWKKTCRKEEQLLGRGKTSRPVIYYTCVVLKPL